MTTTHLQEKDVDLSLKGIGLTPNVSVDWVVVNVVSVAIVVVVCSSVASVGDIPGPPTKVTSPKIFTCELSEPNMTRTRHNQNNIYTNIKRKKSFGLKKVVFQLTTNCFLEDSDIIGKETHHLSTKWTTDAGLSIPVQRRRIIIIVDDSTNLNHRLGIKDASSFCN